MTDLDHKTVLAKRDDIAAVLRTFVDDEVALERANNIAAALQDGVAAPFVAAMRLLEREIPNLERRTRVAEEIRRAWG